MNRHKIFYLLNTIQYRFLSSTCCVQDKTQNSKVQFTENVGLETLVLVHVLTRHGDRTADTTYCPPNDPYKNEKYYPYGPGNLTNKGKLRAYNLGINLKRRYDKFLQDYNPKIVFAQSTDRDRCQCTLQLILAGLFPPTKDLIWLKGFNWQPIKIRSYKREKDKLFPYLRSPELQAVIKEFERSDYVNDLKNKYKSTLDYLSEASGKQVETFLEMLYWYIVFVNEQEFGLQLPDWVLKIYPDPLKEMAIEVYKMINGTKELRALISGPVLKKIINDTQEKIDPESKSETRIYVYCAHAWSISSMLIALNVFEPHVPPYACCLLFEVHKIDSVYGIKVFYFDYTTKDPKPMKLPDCEEFCPLEKFKEIVKDLVQLHEAKK